MENFKPKPPKKKPFPVMSAHFAHTLEDMKEKYIEAEYIEIETTTGIFDTETLQKLKDSRSNLLVYQGKVFRFSKTEGTFLKYINLSVNGFQEFFVGQQIVVDGESGQWVLTDLKSEEEQEIEDLQQDVTDLQTQVNSLNVDGGEIIDA